MQILIDISKDKYNAIVNMYDTFPAEMRRWGLEAIKNGIPLPQGHGRLIDAEKVADYIDSLSKNWNYYNRSPYECGRYESYNYAVDVINEAPTVIEADKEGGKNNG